MCLPRAIACVPLAFMLAACGKTSPQQVLATTFASFSAARYDCIDWQGRKRCVYTIPPDTAPKGLVIALHPAFTSVEMTEKISHIGELAAHRGYAVVFPEGIDEQWNDSRVMTKVKTYNLNIDDVGFINAITVRAQKEFSITAANTTLAGMSNGGMMALRLSCQSEHYGHIATVVANLPVGLRTHCTARPKSTYLVFGGDDDIVKNKGGALADSGVASEWGEVESAKATQNFFVTRNRCRTTPNTNILADAEIDDTKAVIDRYRGCLQPLTIVNVEGMGHTWPGESSRLFAWLSMRGAVSKQFNAGEAMLKFMGAQKNRPPKTERPN